MTTYISILRGINVGEHKKIKMDALRKMYSELGFSKVESYIQSGNVIFSTADTDTQVLEKTIPEKILETFGFEVPVLVLSKEELNNALKNNPYIAYPLRDSTKLFLTFLSAMPDKTILDGLLPTYYAPDEFKYYGKIIYNFCPNGYGNTKLTNTFFEKKLKLTATCRSLKTVSELAILADKLT